MTRAEVAVTRRFVEIVQRLMGKRMSPFDVIAPKWIADLAHEFSLTPEQAAGIVGNLGFESGGFQKLHEIGQPEDRGGFGVAQWTGTRRVAFLSWCQSARLDWRSDEANYGFLVQELRGAYHDVIASLLHCQTVEQAVWSVGQTYERPGGTTKDNLPGYEGRLAWARRALAAHVKPSAAIPAARDLQAALNAAGASPPLDEDGLWGDLSAQALADYYARVA